MGIILWIVFGGFAGWMTSVLMGADGHKSSMLNIIVGIAGALLGGFSMSLIGVGSSNGANLYSFIVAIIVAVSLIAVVQNIINTNS